MPAGYEDQLPESADQDARLRDAFAQLLMLQQQQQPQGGLPPFNGRGEPGAPMPPSGGFVDTVQPQQPMPNAGASNMSVQPGAAPQPGDAPKAPDGPPIPGGSPMPAVPQGAAPPPAGAASNRDMQILEELMRKNKGGTFSLPPSARRFDI